MVRQSEHGGRGWQEGLLDFSASLNPLGPPAMVRELCRRGDTWLSHYPDPDYLALRRGLGAHHGLGPDAVVPGNGASQLIQDILDTWRPRLTMVCEPCFADYARMALRAGSKVAAWALPSGEGFVLRARGLVEALEECGADTVVLGHPNNPTSRLVPPADLTEILAWTMKRGIRVLVDETFLELSTGGEATSALYAGGRSAGNFLEDSPGLAIVRALTKSFCLPGLRVGYALCGTGLASTLRGRMVPWSVNGLAAELGDIHQVERAYLAATAAWLSTEGPAFHQALNGIPGLRALKAEANFVLAHLEPGPGSALPVGAEALDRALRAHGMVVRNAEGFPGLGTGWIRIALRSASENLRLLDSFRLIAQGADGETDSPGIAGGAVIR